MEPACHNCNSLSYCARGQQNDSQFCSSDEYSEILEKVKEIYRTDPGGGHQRDHGQTDPPGSGCYLRISSDPS